MQVMHSRNGKTPYTKDGCIEHPESEATNPEGQLLLFLLLPGSHLLAMNDVRFYYAAADKLDSQFGVALIAILIKPGDIVSDAGLVD